jgi:hypothetical protein
MKYLAICFLSLTAFFTAGTAPSVGASINAPLFASVRVAGVATPRHDYGTDRALAGVLAVALVALQLRRRQKSLRMPRQFR